MSGLLGPVLIIVWKDILLEIRSRDLVISVLVFGLLVVIVFNFALNNAPGRAEELAPGILWAAFAFAAVLAMNRAFVRDQEQGGLEGLLISPISRDAIFLGKVLTSLIFMLLVEAALLPVYAVMLDFSALSWTLLLTIFLGTLGFAVVGTLFSAMAVQTRSREIMLPVLFFPVVLPVIIAAVEASTRAVGGETFVGLGRWLPLIGVFDALFLVICPWIFSFVVEE
ncbi:MAG TPA: heme ABC transporter permease CcmB [Dehalococcoidia bacterium]|nr:heme ABC transporter permease CcmB [SAR202 cluster bacterium]HAA95479.1 heme ABC transporter permease CcmB [Dehalococcoidia bacterium]|tara:strand:- start:3236 stop:3910 length:675 start_codon:yes stop_codon:yes gene_type:complete